MQIIFLPGFVWEIPLGYLSELCWLEFLFLSGQTLIDIAVSCPFRYVLAIGMKMVKRGLGRAKAG